MSNFFVQKAEDMDLLIEGEGDKDDQRKIKSCSVCKVQKANHIVREYANTGASGGNSGNTSAISGDVRGFSQGALSIGDQLRQQVLNLAPREVIEQVIFDPQHGIVKREIHFGIIDYLTVSCKYH